MPGPLIAKAQSGRVNIRSTQQIGRTWMEKYLVNVRSVNGRALLATVTNYWRNGTIFSIDHRDHLTPLGAGGGTPLINQPIQRCANPENFGAWSPNVGTVGITTGQADPFGGTSASLLTDDDAGFDESILGSFAFSGDGTKSLAMFVRAGTAALSAIGLRDGTASVWRHLVIITWTAGVPSLSTSAGSGTLFAVESWDNGWYRISFSANSVIAANSNWPILYPAGIVASATGTLYAFGVNGWDSSVPAGYIGPSHLTATGNRISLDGATASVTNWLRAGDLLSIGALAPSYEVTADTNSQAGGYVTVPINPPIFTAGAPADNAVVTITGMTLQACILEPPTFPTTSGSSADFGELTVKFSESL